MCSSCDDEGHEGFLVLRNELVDDPPHVLEDSDVILSGDVEEDGGVTIRSGAFSIRLRDREATSLYYALGEIYHGD